MTTSAEKTNEIRFLQYHSFAKLRELAKKPFDLTRDGNLTPERMRKMQVQACGFKLLFATERVDDAILDALGSLSKEAQVIEKMRAMQSGEVINCVDGFDCENRSVLHTAVRDFFDAPNHSPVAQEAAGLAKAEFDKLRDFCLKIDEQGRFTDLVVVGIGGSDLGPRAVCMALQAYNKEGRRVHFISNVDPDDAAGVLRGVDFEKALVAVVSKSGTTLETATNEDIVRTQFEKAGLKPKDHFIAVTGKGSPMDDPEKYLASFYIWDYIGGRFSVTSMVGGVPLSFALGFEGYEQLLRGAHAVDKLALEEDPKKNLPLLTALFRIWNQNFLSYPTVAVIPYSQALIRFSAHVQQCVMESNGKGIDRCGKPLNFQTGPIIWGEPGTNAQHSFFQLIHQGTHIVPVEFMGFRENQYSEDILVKGTTSQEKLLANLFAQSLALAQGKKEDNPNKAFSGNRPNNILLCNQLDAYAMGALLAYYEHTVAFQGFIWDVNSWDQEGVQLGKVLANGILRCYDKKRKGEEWQEGECPLCCELISQLESL